MVSHGSIYRITKITRCNRSRDVCITRRHPTNKNNLPGWREGVNDKECMWCLFYWKNLICLRKQWIHLYWRHCPSDYRDRFKKLIFSSQYDFHEMKKKLSIKKYSNLHFEDFNVKTWCKKFPKFGRHAIVVWRHVLTSQWISSQ